MAPAAAPVVSVVDPNDALGTDDACALLARLARREVSGAELRAAAMVRANAADERLNAVTTWVDMPLRSEVHVAPDAPFSGLPTLIKDNDDLTGYPTSQGSRAVPDTRARACSPFAAHLVALGLDPIAKTTMPEFGLTPSTESSRFGATANPWDPTRSAGGSSGGSAALVAAGVVPIAHGNDGGGSIRIPAAACGLVGLKPSRGRLVDRPEYARLPVPLGVQGVLTRTVRDTARFHAESERHRPAPGLPPIGLVEGPGSRRVRVALTVDAVRGLPVDEPTLAATRAVARLLASLGHHVDEVAPAVDERLGTDFLRYWQLIALGLVRGGASVFGPRFDPARTEPLTRDLARRAASSAVRMPGSIRRLRQLVGSARLPVPQTHDVVLSPVLGHVTPLLGHLGPDVEPRTMLIRMLRWVSFTPAANVTGAPAISLPLGRSPSGLPIGVQLTAPLGQERLLLELAFELEAAAPWPVGVGAAQG